MAPISFNGHEYDDVSAMPPDVRQLYQLATEMFADKDGDGVPDALTALKNAKIMSTSQFLVDGHAYASPDQMPPEARAAYQRVMGSFDANGDGVPDVLQRHAAAASTVATSTPAASTPGATPASASPAASSVPQVTVIGDGRRAPLAWAAVVLTMTLLLGVIVYLLMSR